MADESEDTLEERIESIQRRAENFRDLLKDGEEVTIAYHDGEVHVEQSYRTKFELQHPKLFGRMIAVEAQMNAGWLPTIVALLVSGVVILGLQASWWTPLVGEQVCELLNHWWFYGVLVLMALYLGWRVNGGWARYVYHRHREELLRLMGLDNLDRDVLLVMLRDDGLLESVVYQLKLDTRPPLAA